METIHRAENIMEYLKWIIGILVGVFYSVHNFTWLLLVLMIIDTLFGFAVARKRKNLSPSVAADGATGKVYRLGVVATMAIIEYFVNVPGIDLTLGGDA